MYKMRKVYFHGNIVCYGYFAFQGQSFAVPILKNEVRKYLHMLPYKRKAYGIFTIMVKLLMALHFSIIDPVKPL